MSISRRLRAGSIPLALGLLISCSAAPKLQKAQEGRSLFWTASKDGGQPLWLLGSIHLGTASSLPIPPSVSEAWKEADGLVVEVDIGGLDASESEALLAARSRLPAGAALGDTLDPALYNELRTAFSLHGIPLQRMQDRKPWFLALMLQILEFQSLGYGAEGGVDHRLLGWAARDGKPVEELETAAFQLDLFDGLPGDLQVLLVQNSLRPREVIFQELQDMEEAWRTGDVSRMEAIIQRDVEKEPRLLPFHKTILEDRNVAMEEKIDALYQQGKRWMVVVGAGHMIGEQGIVTLLRERGYRVEQH